MTFTGLVLSGTVQSGRPPICLWGSNVNGTINVRSLYKIEHPKPIIGSPLSEYDKERILLSVKLSNSMQYLFQSKTYGRMKRTINYFFDGVRSDRVYDKLHLFVRVIEGFIIPEIGTTKSRFKSRTELFIGPRYHNLMDNLYDIRSQIEHVHSPFDVISGNTKVDKELELRKKAYLSESIARYCLTTLCTNKQLWEHFKNETTIGAFWKKSDIERQKIWGKELNVLHTMSLFQD